MRAVLLLLIACTLGGHLFAQKINFGKKTRITRFDHQNNNNKVDDNSGADQKVGVDQLFEMLNWDHLQIDTSMKKRGYLLMQKDVDTTSSLFQYSNTDHKQDGPTTIRSFTYMDARVGGLQGRMITYRTYDKDEFSNISGYLLSHNYQRTNQFEMGDEKHSIYSNGEKTIHIKVITSEVKKQTFTAYELELGK